MTNNKETKVPRSIYAVAVMALLAIVPTGCGSDNKDSAKAPTKAEFLKRGNAICKAGNARTEAQAKAALGPGKPSAAKFNQVVTQTIIPNIQREVSDIRKLTPPMGDEADVKRILDSAQGDLDRARTNPAVLMGSSDPFAESNKMARDYGLTVCGST